MAKQIAFFIIIFFFIDISLFGQHSAFKTQAINLEVFYTVTQPITLEKFYDPSQSGTDIFTMNSSGIEGRIGYSKSITNRTNFQVSMMGGSQAIRFEVPMPESFKETGWDDYKVYSNSLETAYVGFQIGGRVAVFQTTRSIVSVFGHATLLHVLPLNTGISFSRGLDNGVTILDVEMDISFKDKKNSFIYPEIGLSYSYKITDHLSLKASFIKPFLYKEIINGSYMILGDNEVLNGQFSQRHYSIALGLSVAYTF